MSEATSPGQKLRAAVAANDPLQVVGAVNAYNAIMAQKSGHQALYLSGGGVAACSGAAPFEHPTAANPTKLKKFRRFNMV